MKSTEANDRTPLSRDQKRLDVPEKQVIQLEGAVHHGFLDRIRRIQLTGEIDV